jgi:molecular chaperone DnaK (HSP70)
VPAAITRVSGFLLAVDYGTVNTVAVLSRPDGQVRQLLVDGSPLVPSGAYVGPDGRLLVGRDAERAGRVDPAAYVADPRSRINAGTVALGRSTFPVVEVIGATLARIAQEAIRGAGGQLHLRCALHDQRRQ